MGVTGCGCSGPLAYSGSQVTYGRVVLGTSWPSRAWIARPPETTVVLAATDIAAFQERTFAGLSGCSGSLAGTPATGERGGGWVGRLTPGPDMVPRAGGDAGASVTIPHARCAVLGRSPGR